MFPTKQRETWPSEGTLGNIIHIVHTRTRNPKPPRAEAARRGAGRQALLENRHRFMYSYIQHNFLSTTERGSPAGKTDPRQTDSFCIRHQRGHGYRNLKKRGLDIDGPLLSALPSTHPSAATTTARPGPGPRGQPHPVELSLAEKRIKESPLSDLSDGASGKRWAWNVGTQESERRAEAARRR